MPESVLTLRPWVQIPEISVSFSYPLYFFYPPTLCCTPRGRGILDSSSQGKIALKPLSVAVAGSKVIALAQLNLIFLFYLSACWSTSTRLYCLKMEAERGECSLHARCTLYSTLAIPLPSPAPLPSPFAPLLHHTRPHCTPSYCYSPLWRRRAALAAQTSSGADDPLLIHIHIGAKQE